MSKISMKTLQAKKDAAEKITMLTAYDAGMARLIDAAGIDAILVGDSCANVISGHPNTLPVTVDQIIYHSQAVARGAQNALIIADMPFMSYQLSTEHAISNAGRLIQEGRAEAVKVEVNPKQLSHIQAIIDTGIPLIAHIGFTPQAIHQIGGYKIQGKGEQAAETLLSLAKTLEKMGAQAILLEMVPASVAKTITEAIKVPSIGIGAGPHCDGQILVTHDLLGLTQGPVPKFAKAYSNLAAEMTTAITAYKDEVRTEAFPDQEHSYE